MADEKDKGGQPPGEGKGDGKVSVTVRLPADLVEKVDAVAEEELRSRTAQIQKILEESTTKQPPAGKR